jgi:hypothetical protein
MTAPNSLLLCVSPGVSRDAQHPSDKYDLRAIDEEDCPEPSVRRLDVHRVSCSSCMSISIIPDTTQSADVAAKAALSDHIGYPA